MDAEVSHRADPSTFSIPRSDVRRGLVPGALVKLLFGVSGAPVAEERMWVEVTEIVGDRYRGRLDDTPEAIADLREGDLIDFGPEHVAAVWRDAEDGPRPEQFAIVSTRIWRDGLPPKRARRAVSPDEAFSGWLLFAEDDPATPDARLSGFEPVTHEALLERWRSFDSIEEEGPGTEWRWDETGLEWRRADGGEGAPAPRHAPDA